MNCCVGLVSAWRRNLVCLRGGLSQFRPDPFPRLLTKVSAVQLPARSVLDLSSPGGIHVPPATEALVQVRLAHSELGREGPASLWGDADRGHCDRMVAIRYRFRKGAEANRFVKMGARECEMLEAPDMETAGDRRRRKLALLCDMHGRDTVAELSGTNTFALEQVLKRVLLPPKKDGTRSPRHLGDKAARAIEYAFRLGEGWFDAPDDVEAFSPEALTLARAYEKMTPSERSRLGHLLAAALVDIDLKPTDLGKTPATELVERRRVPR